MGLDAKVRCRCWEEGKIKPLPFPEHIRLNLDEGYFELDLPYEGNEDKFSRFDIWTEDCCPHGDLTCASEYISNWTGYRLFQEALGQVGWERFPVLKAQLPERNGGSTDSESAAQALRELEHFERHARLGPITVLVDSDSGYVIFKHVYAYAGEFILDGRSGLNAGVDPSGFFIRQAQSPNREVFRARRFEQRLLGPQRVEGPNGDDSVEYTDADTGRQFVGRIAVPGRTIAWPDGRWENDAGQRRFEYPRRLHVEERQRGADEFADIVKSLRTVFQASVATGNPVHWC